MNIIFPSWYLLNVLERDNLYVYKIVFISVKNLLSVETNIYTSVLCMYLIHETEVNAFLNVQNTTITAYNMIFYKYAP